MTVNKIKIVAISDTHGYHNKLTIPSCDILIHAGDMTSHGRESDIRKFFRWFKKQPAKHHVCIMGNHEKIYEQCLPLSKTWIYEEFPEVHLLDDSGVQIEELKLWGSAWTPFFYNWAFNAYRGEDIKKHWDIIPSGLDILITHGPLNGVLDHLPWDNTNVGCEELAIAVERTKPKFFVHGHIHLHGGKSEQYKDTKVFNVAICDEDYRAANKITEFEL